MSDITLIHVLNTADPTAAVSVSESYGTLKGDENGAMWIRPLATLGAGIGLQTSRNPTADAVASAGVIAFDVAAFNYIYDEAAGVWDRERRFTSADNMPDIEARSVISFGMGYDGTNWDRLRADGNDASVVSNDKGHLVNISCLYGRNATTGNWDRIYSSGTDADAQTPNSSGILNTKSHMMGYSDANNQWHRLLSNDDDGDAVAVTTVNQILATVNRNMAYNGSSYDRLRSGSLSATSFTGDSQGALKTISALHGRNGDTGDWERIFSSGIDADGISPASSSVLDVKNHQYAWNGVSYDRIRANTQFTPFSSAARTASSNTGAITNHNARGITLIIDVSVYPAAASVVFNIEEYDSTSGQYVVILASAAITAVGTTRMRIYPGLVGAAGLVANDILPRNFRISAVHADADSITYSVGAQTVL